ncbi:Hypothetical predicted protein, partial [Olea europaea subsp. europaea]
PNTPQHAQITVTHTIIDHAPSYTIDRRTTLHKLSDHRTLEEDIKWEISVFKDIDTSQQMEYHRVVTMAGFMHE